MKEHLIKNAGLMACLYCSSELHGSWVSEFHVDHHYKSVVCSCGKKNMIKVNFHGSGHDKWNVTFKSNVNDEIGVIGFEEMVNGEHKKLKK